jgi:hypothetical protein
MNGGLIVLLAGDRSKSSFHGFLRNSSTGGHGHGVVTVGFSFVHPKKSPRSEIR